MRSVLKMVIEAKKILVALLLLKFSFPAESGVQFDFFKLVLVWPNTYCNQAHKWCKQPIPKEFKVHGLWPYTNHHGHAKNCTTTSFTKSEFENWNFYSRLTSFWPNFDMYRSDIDFLEREWKNHGSCTGVLTTSDQLYKREILHNEITKAVGSSVRLRCIKNRKAAFELQLREFHICINIRGVAFDCPFLYSKCGFANAPVLFPRRYQGKAHIPSSILHHEGLIGNLSRNRLDIVLD